MFISNTLEALPLYVVLLILNEIIRLNDCKYAGTKDGSQGHDWSRHLRSVTRVCMEWLNSAELIQMGILHYFLNIKYHKRLYLFIYLIICFPLEWKFLMHYAHLQIFF